MSDRLSRPSGGMPQGLCPLEGISNPAAAPAAKEKDYLKFYNDLCSTVARQCIALGYSVDEQSAERFNLHLAQNMVANLRPGSAMLGP